MEFELSQFFVCGNNTKQTLKDLLYYYICYNRPIIVLGFCEDNHIFLDNIFNERKLVLGTPDVKVKVKVKSFGTVKYASMQVCKYASMQVCKYASM